MKTLSRITFVFFFALFGNVNFGAASGLPECVGSPTSNFSVIKSWHNCVGFFVHTGGTPWSIPSSISGEYRNGDLNGHGTWIRTGKMGSEARKQSWDHFKGDFPVKYEGNWKDGMREGFGVQIYESGKVQKGIWKKNEFVGKYKASPLRSAFTKLSKQQREQLQENLKDLGFYNSSVDGLYGKMTERALIAYNQQNLQGSDLKTARNVKNLIDSVLELNSEPEENLAPNFDEKYKVASGSGFYVSEQGHLITNHHVIDGCQDIKVHFRGNIFDTRTIADDKRNDLALLKTNETTGHAFALSTESPFPLQEVIVAGYPFGEKVSSSLKYTQGIVSAVAGIGNDYSQIQIDAAIQPGNSGGPIFDKYGNVVAAAVAKLNLKKILTDYGVVPENTNFGVKSSAIRNLLEGNGVSPLSPNFDEISKKELSRAVDDGTVMLSCWMTMAQISDMKSKKVMFQDLQHK